MSEEKPERRGRDRDEKGGEGLPEKWRRDPITGVFLALVLIALGVTLFLAAQEIISWDQWWAYFILGLGGAFLIEALVRYTQPAYRRPVFGRLMAGLVLICIGVANIVGVATWWPLILVVVGLAILFYVWQGRKQ